MGRRKQMSKLDWELKNNKAMSELLRQGIPKDQKEKDIFHLKCILYGIGYQSRWYRWGYISTLRRAIKAMENSK